MKQKFIPLVIFLVLIYSLPVFSQSSKINNYLRLVAEGKVESVKSRIPDLLNEYGEEPGVLLLQGVVQENAQNATPYYKKILDKYPNSEWAQHAWWRLIQYYAVVSDTATAKKMLNQFRNKYPTSPFLSVATDIVKLSISDAKYHNREKYHNIEIAETKNAETPIVDTPTQSIALIKKEKYGLQVGLYSTKEAANTEREKFIKTARMKTEVLEKLVMGERKYAVVIGDYDSEDEAMDAVKYVERDCKCVPLIYKKK